MKRKNDRPTGWVRYRISDRSGCGWDRDRWLFSPGIEQACSTDEIRELIIALRESWAIHAESYSFRLWLYETPSIEVIADQREAKKRSITVILNEIEILSRQIDMKRELTTI